MEPRIEEYFKTHQVGGKISDTVKDKSTVHTRQIIIYVLSEFMNARTIALWMDCSIPTVYNSIKAHEKRMNDAKNGRSYSFWAMRTKLDLAYNYDLEFLEKPEKIPIQLRK